MAEYGVLHQEPRYKVDNFVDELMGRSREVIAIVGPEIKRLVISMIEQFTAFKCAHYLITLDNVRFVNTMWMQDSGKLVLTFGMGSKPADRDMPKHLIVDTFVTELVRDSVPESFRDEMAGFVRALVWQFSLIKKHALIDLSKFPFTTPQWINDRELIIGLLYNGKPYTPKQARF